MSSNEYFSHKPKKRSHIRMLLGKLYFTWSRYALWFFGRSRNYAKTVQKPTLPYGIAMHRTPLYRQLRNVDMWLQENKVVNLSLAAANLNGLIIRPGETFSFWRLVGKPTKRKGYREGMVLANGKFYPGTGGGLCQLSNLIYWMTLHTPLTVTERWRHTHDVFPDSNRTQPFGSGATVVYNYIDLQLRNDTTESYQLLVQVGDKDLLGEWRCEKPSAFKYEVYESQHAITQEWWGGYMRHNVLKRRIFDADDIHMGDELVTENHAIMMYEPLLESGRKI